MSNFFKNQQIKDILPQRRLGESKYKLRVNKIIETEKIG